MQNFGEVTAEELAVPPTVTLFATKSATPSPPDFTCAELPMLIGAGVLPLGGTEVGPVQASA